MSDVRIHDVTALLIDQKRGGALRRVTFDQNLAVASDTPDDLIAIDDALRALAAQYERKSQVVELRFFGGLSVEETAEVLTISPETVMRGLEVREELATARAFGHHHWPLTHDSWRGGSCTSVSGRTLTRRQAYGSRVPKPDC